MKIVLAPDSFKGSLSARQFCDIVTEALREHIPEAEILSVPLADGGEGTLEALASSGDYDLMEASVMGPLPDMQVQAKYLFSQKTKLAFIEMAQAAGLTLLDEKQRNPMKTTTFGVGELVREAANRGASKVFLGLGGSATNDMGVGAARALGWKFLNSAGQEIPHGAEGLSEIATLQAPERLNLPEVQVLCDVRNPLCGENGASYTYGPQKGADADMLRELESAVSHAASCVKDTLNIDLREREGAGAAGGMAAGAMAFMKGKLSSGIDSVFQFLDIEEKFRNADWIISGEGSFDSQSLEGKVIDGILRKKAVTSKVIVIAGSVKLAPSEWKALGIEEVYSLLPSDQDLSWEQIVQQAPENLRRETRRFIDHCLSSKA